MLQKGWTSGPSPLDCESGSIRTDEKVLQNATSRALNLSCREPAGLKDDCRSLLDLVRWTELRVVFLDHPCHSMLDWVHWTRVTWLLSASHSMQLSRQGNTCCLLRKYMGASEFHWL